MQSPRGGVISQEGSSKSRSAVAAASSTFTAWQQGLDSPDLLIHRPEGATGQSAKGVFQRRKTETTSSRQSTTSARSECQYMSEAKVGVEDEKGQIRQGPAKSKARGAATSTKARPP